MKYMVTMPALCLVLAFLYLVQAADVRAKNFPVNSNVAGIRVTTTVDTALARDLLLSGEQNPLSGMDGGIAAEFDCHSIYDLPTTDRLQKITRDYSIDTATALLIRCLVGVPEINRSQALFLTALEEQRSGSASQAAFLCARSDQYTVLFVPGWGYLSNGETTGSDLRQPREIISAMGFETHLVAIEDFGSIEANAAIVAGALRSHLGSGKQVILASASSGGPAVALAIGHQDIADHPRLAGWINICGVLRGSPVVDRFLPWPRSLLPRLLALFEGWTYRDLLSMSQANSISRFDDFSAPSQLTILNYIGIPFSGQVSPTGRTLYGLLKHLGPNDGLTLITEALAPGYTIMAVGSDHFIREDRDIDMKTAALLPVLLKLIEG